MTGGQSFTTDQLERSLIDMAVEAGVFHAFFPASQTNWMPERVVDT